MKRDGLPVLPPDCPAVCETGAAVDLAGARFAWHIHDCEAGPDGFFTATELFGSFFTGDIEDPDVLAETEALTVPIGTEESYLGSRIGPDEMATTVESGERLEAMRQKFCERVLECSGVVNGTCWALGEDAVRAVLHEVTDV